MKKTLTLLLSIIFLSVTADEVSKKEAIKVADNFYFERNYNSDENISKGSLTRDIYAKYVNNIPVFYYINFNEAGWVVVSAQSSIRPIIAYSYTGNYSPDFEPDNFKAWMNQYASQVKEVIDENIHQSQEIKMLWDHYLSDDIESFKAYKRGRNVEPLIFTTWDQGLFYNEMCPPDPAGQGGHCLTGCVPTCMGQIINYFRWPQTGVGEYSYDGGDYGTLSANFGESTYNWNEMPTSLTKNSLETAQILYHLGVSCDLVYGPSGSGMYNHKAAYALRTYFKYSPDTEYLYRDSTDLNWDSVIIAHLDQKIPMYYAGWSVPNINGHAFACDGYENDDYFHFNWGWSGSYDGYFYTDNLNPGGNNFNLAQELIINCFPDTSNYNYPLLNTGVDTVTAIMGTLDDGSGPIYNYTDNQNCGWLISPADSILYITLDFYKFNLSSGDSLYVYDGESSSSELIAVLSGNDIPDPISSSGTSLYLNFVTNDTDNSEGWLVGYTSELPVFCSGNNMITETSGSISDGSGDANYQNLTTCIWIISPGTTDDIHLEFNSFSTEEDHDFLTIYDGSTNLGAFSGQTAPENITATQGTLTLVFSTNSSNTDQGWSANYYTGFVGQTEVNENSLKYYPNPVNSELNISNTEGFDKVKIYTISGKMILNINIENQRNLKVNTSSLAEGMYLIKATGSKNSVTKKFLVKH